MSEAHKTQLHKIAERLRKQRLDDVAALLGLPAGRRFLGRLLEDWRLFKLSYTGNAQTHFFEGIRNVGLKVLDELTDANEDALEIVMKEYRKEKAEHDRAIADAGSSGAE